jgi:hypothetical protein
MRAIVRFSFETAIAAVALVATFSFLTWLIGDSLGLGFFAYVGIVPLFAIIVLVLFFTARFAALRRLIAAIVILSVGQYGAMHYDAARAESAMAVPAPAGTRTAKAVDLSGLLENCDRSCVEVLAKSGADVVLQDRTYHLVRGEQCRTSALRPLYFEFLKAGYAGLCAEETRAARPQVLLVVGQVRCAWHDDDTLCGQLPRSFSGYINVVREEGATGSQLLDRWPVGDIAPISHWFMFVGLERLIVGDSEHGAILSRALGMPLQGAGIPGRGDLNQVLTEMESFLDDPVTARPAAYYLHDLSSVRGKEDPALLRSHILDLLRSGNSMRVRAGLELITSESRVNVSDMRHRVEELAQSADTLVRDSARRALMAITKR